MLGEDADIEDGKDEAEAVDMAPGGLEVNGAPADDELLAELHPDDDTTITFVRGDASNDVSEASVDVIITGRDGGPDYGALIMDGAATPLELYVALAGRSAAVPEALDRAHASETRVTRAGDVRVRVPALKLAAAAPGTGEVDNTTALSTYSCLSWPNFLDQLSRQFVGAPGRDQRASWDDFGAHVLSSPDPGWTWDGGRTDIYVCNFNSEGNTPDSIRPELGHENITGTETQSYFTTLADGWYARRLYGPTAGANYRYWGRADPLPAGNTLLSFIGIVRRN